MMADGVCENVAHIRKRLHRVSIIFRKIRSRLESRQLWHLNAATNADRCVSTQ